MDVYNYLTDGNLVSDAAKIIQEMEVKSPESLSLQDKVHFLAHKAHFLLFKDTETALYEKYRLLRRKIKATIPAFQTDKTAVVRQKELQKIKDINPVIERLLNFLKHADLKTYKSTSEFAIVLSQEECLKIAEEYAICSLGFDSLQKIAIGNFYKLGADSHCTVLRHLNHRDLIFKDYHDLVATEKQVAGNAGIRKLCENKGLNLIQAPPCLVIDIPGQPSRKLYVEKRIPMLLSSGDQERLLNELMTYYIKGKDPKFRENLCTLLYQCALLIKESGYWDVGVHNFPLYSALFEHFFIIDFERLFLNDAENTKKNIECGLERLAIMFPNKSLWENSIRRAYPNYELPSFEKLSISWKPFMSFPGWFSS